MLAPETGGAVVSAEMHEMSTVSVATRTSAPDTPGDFSR